MVGGALGEMRNLATNHAIMDTRIDIEHVMTLNLLMVDFHVTVSVFMSNLDAMLSHAQV